MRIVTSGRNIQLLGEFAKIAERMASPRARTELQRGVVDAGRKVKTRVQRAVTAQMGLRPGNYQSYVVANTRGVSRPALLAFDIFGVKGGADIEAYQGLRAVKRGNRLNRGRGAAERGEVRSAVWNSPRIFKRSFATSAGDFYAMRPATAGTTTKAPKIFWTYGRKEEQPRGPGGRFGKGNGKYGKLRRLYGPALLKEIPEDDSLATFMRIAPPLLQIEVEKRLTKLMRW